MDAKPKKDEKDDAHKAGAAEKKANPLPSN